MGNQGVIYTMPYLKFTNFMKKISKMIKFSFLVDFPTFNTEDMKGDCLYWPLWTVWSVYDILCLRLGGKLFKSPSYAVLLFSFI